MAHLTEPVYAQLIRGELPPDEAAAWARHLATGCDACEAFLAARPEPDALDARADRALAALGPPGAPGNDLEYRRIEQRLAAEARGAGRLRLPRPALAVAAGVVAAGLAGLWLASRAPERPGRPEWTGEKGMGAAPAAVPVRLRFLVIAGGAGAPSVEKGVSGQAVPAAASLQFEVELGRAAQVALARAAPGRLPEVFFRASLPAGRTVVAVEGRPAAYPLADLSGPQRFVAIASSAPLDEAAAARAAGQVAGGARMEPIAPGLEGLSVDAVDVTVQ
ncbi:hypothetical protein [Anaeromyxobacter sp. PSR-1]|uniref:hypothetical protein n=1 Tax=unclassified Anaeromyxobacter TaxID=2620896 RepID=UPI0005DABA8B|nr:hypothetical protein [Anaeromyxobacter sp. PSR-1]GAO04148.1 hypothetical protein PSR1_03036 [Anaeromyxobacter sp. PSR-1]